MVVLKDVKVNVVVDGRALVEYDDSDEAADGDDNAIVRYIQVQSGKEFSILVEATAKPRKSEGFCALACYIYIDGQLCDTPLLKELPISRMVNHTVSGSENGKSLGRNLTFSNVDIGEMQDGEQTSARQLKTLTDKLGCIEVKVFRVRKVTEADMTNEAPRFFTHTELAVIPEKALKGEGKSHRLSLGPEKAVPNQVMNDCHYLDPGSGKPWLSFTLKYRSRGEDDSAVTRERCREADDYQSRSKH